MFTATRFKASNCGLGSPNTLCNFSLCDPCGNTSLKEFIKELKLFAQLIVFRFHICALKGTSFKFFMS